MLLNNYPMDEAARLVEQGRYPGQHLWGCRDLPPDWSWTVAPQSLIVRGRDGVWARRAKRLVWSTVGDPRQCRWAIRERRDADVIYAADQQSPALLGLMRRARAYDVPIVVMLHNGPKQKWAWRWLRGVDAVLVLAEGVARRVEPHLRGGPPVHVMPWGPDLSSPIYQSAGSGARDLDFVAAGKTNRDYSSLRRVAASGRLTGVIYASSGVERFVDGVATTSREPNDYPAVMTSMARSHSVVIPLRDADRLSGLTELADAMALDVPVLVTKSALMPFDVEQCGVGRCIDPDDDSGLAAALASPRPPGREEARRAVLATHNMAAFSAELVKVFDAVSGGSRQP